MSVKKQSFPKLLASLKEIITNIYISLSVKLIILVLSED